MTVETSVEFIRLVYRCTLDYVTEKARAEACSWGDCANGHAACELHFQQTNIPDLLRRIRKEPNIHRNIWDHVRGALESIRVSAKIMTEANALAGEDLGNLSIFGWY